MMTSDIAPPTANHKSDRYLVLQRGSARVEVYTLLSGQRITIGRSETNGVVIPDPKCSRQHCEIFSAGAHWKLRDLGARNGVTVDGSLIRGDWNLLPGQKVDIGQYQLLFTDCSEGEADRSTTQADGTSYVVLDQMDRTQYDNSASLQSPTEFRAKAIVNLIRLGREMSAAENIETLGKCVLDGLIDGTPAASGAILLLTPSNESPGSSAASAPEQLYQPVATLRRPKQTGEAYSSSLSAIVLRDQKALLAHDVEEQAQFLNQDSVQQIAAASAICAPIRHEGNLLGLIHLYAFDPTSPLDREHLDFTLAIADQMGTILPTIRRHEEVVHRVDKLQTERQELIEQLDIETEFVGESDALALVKRSMGRVAVTDATVLIRGESGVGKELVARGIHRNSKRKEGPFICVNCAALTESLLESELFGHEKGAFTGAGTRKAGKFEQAHGGTLFLDEVGEMSPEIQAKFLRVLEGQAFERVGGGAAIHVDVRVVTATNRDLEQAVQEGRFRQDLFYRLQVIELLVPPLREHPEDVPKIAQHFVDRFARRSGSKVEGFNSAAIRVLMQHTWPGNVRELRNVVERAVILSDRNVLTPDDIHLSRLVAIPRDSSAASSDTGNSPVSKSTSPSDTGGSNTDTVLGVDGLWRTYIDQGLTLDEIDKIYIDTVLERFNWNKSQAARLLGIERTTLDRRLKKYDMQRPGDPSISDNEDDPTV